MNITDFLLARIEEDEKHAAALLRDLEGQVSEEYAGVVDEKGPMTPARLLSAQMWAHYDGQSKRRSFAKGQQIAYLANPARVLAECAAKRAIIEQVSDVAWGGYAVRDVVLGHLAAVYKTHPDYRDDWA